MTPEPGFADSAIELATASDDLLAEVESLIARLAAHPDPEVGLATTKLLEHVDAVHRTALTHLMGAIQSMAGDAFINRLTGDPAIRLLLMSYNLLAVDRRTLTEEALDAVRGHLHSHGVDIELLDVLGGVVTIRVHGIPSTDATYPGVVRDIQEALTAGLLGFQELEIQDGKGARPAPAASVFLPVGSLKRAFRPVYRDVGPAAEFVTGTLRSVLVDGANVLIARVDGEFFAVRNACGESPLPLDYSTLHGTELTCSWHQCRYDVRTGARLDRPDSAREEWLTVLPIRVSEGIVQVVVGTERVSPDGAPT